MNILTKKCSKCGIEKELLQFHFRKDSNTYRNECKDCGKLYRINNKEKRKLQKRLYNEKNKEKTKLYHKLYNEKNKEQRKLQDKLYKEKNKEKINLQNKLYNEKNKEKIKLYKEKHKEKITLQHTLYFKNRRKTDINFKLLTTMRTRILSAIKKQYSKKAYRSIQLLGCSIEEVRKHLEAQFKPGMSWDNHGQWHIDHIIPCSIFDLTDPVEQKQCFHYTNLQPLWAEENLSKSDKCH